MCRSMTAQHSSPRRGHVCRSTLLRTPLSAQRRAADCIGQQALNMTLRRRPAARARAAAPLQQQAAHLEQRVLYRGTVHAGRGRPQERVQQRAARGRERRVVRRRRGVPGARGQAVLQAAAARDAARAVRIRAVMRSMCMFMRMLTDLCCAAGPASSLPRARCSKAHRRRKGVCVFADLGCPTEPEHGAVQAAAALFTPAPGAAQARPAPSNRGAEATHARTARWQSPQRP